MELFDVIKVIEYALEEIGGRWKSILKMIEVNGGTFVELILLISLDRISQATVVMSSEGTGNVAAEEATRCMVEEHRRLFDDYLSKLSRNCKVISRADLEKIRRFLQGNETNLEKRLQKRRRRYGMRLANFPSAVDCLCVVREGSSTDTTSANVPMSELRRVVCKEELFDVIYRVHYIVTKHAGYHNVYEVICREYSHITQSMVEMFTSMCQICQRNRVQNVTSPLQPIISSGFLERVQIDLIDYSGQPDDCWKWICHVIDHFSKFHILFPLKTKEALEVAHYLIERVFSVFGLPYILHSDNGREFVNHLIRDLVEQWPGSCKLINGRPRHPQSQGCVEKANDGVHRKIAAKRQETGLNVWSTWLPEIQFALNTQKCRTTQKTPFEVVFGQLPNVFTDVAVDGIRSDVIREEDLPEMLPSHINADDVDHNQGNNMETLASYPVNTNADNEASVNETCGKANATDNVGCENDESHEIRFSDRVGDFQESEECIVIDGVEVESVGSDVASDVAQISDDVDDPTVQPEVTEASKVSSISESSEGSDEEPEELGVLHDIAAEDETLMDENEVRLFLKASFDARRDIADGTGMFSQTGEIHDLIEKRPLLHDITIKFLESAVPDLFNIGYPQSGNHVLETCHILKLRYMDPGNPSLSPGKDRATCNKPHEASPRRVFIRDAARRNLRANAESMKEQYARKKYVKVLMFNIGDNVTVRVPKEDRCKGDPLRLAAVVVGKSGKKCLRYKLACGVGTLEGTFSSADLLPFNGTVIIGNEDEEITLREASRVLSAHKTSDSVCKCKSSQRCTSKRCPCVKSGRPCSKRCHSSLDCSNLCSFSGNKPRMSCSPTPVRMAFPAHGGTVLDGTKKIHFSNTCPVDNWLMLMRAIYFDFPVAYDDLVIRSAEQCSQMSAVLNHVRKADFQKAKLVLAALNDLPLEHQRYDFYGRERDLFINKLPFCLRHHQTSTCSSPVCPSKVEERLEEDILTIPSTFETSEEIIQAVEEWVLRGWSAPCQRPFVGDLPDQAYVQEILNSEMNVVSFYCNGIRSFTCKMFADRLPILLPIAVHDVDDASLLPMDIVLSTGDRYVHVGTTMHRTSERLCDHYTAVVRVRSKSYFYDGLAPYPHHKPLTGVSLNEYSCQFALYVLLL